MSNQKILISDNPFQEAANRFCNLAIESIRDRGRFVVALSGGKTPVELFKSLVAQNLPWEKFFVFWSDERNVPKASPESNYSLAWENWLTHVDIPENQIFPFKTEGHQPEAVAREYENTIRTVLKTSGDDLPRFDLLLLGLGTDGHTASIFTCDGFDEKHLVQAHWIEKLNSFRYTLSPQLINESRNIQVLVTGTEKSQIVSAIFSSSTNLKLYPIELIKPKNGELVWLLDKAAATKLPLDFYR